MSKMFCCPLYIDPPRGVGEGGSDARAFLLPPLNPLLNSSSYCYTPVSLRWGGAPPLFGPESINFTASWYQHLWAGLLDTGAISMSYMLRLAGFGLISELSKYINIMFRLRFANLQYYSLDVCHATCIHARKWKCRKRFFLIKNISSNNKARAACVKVVSLAVGWWLRLDTPFYPQGNVTVMLTASVHVCRYHGRKYEVYMKMVEHQRLYRTIMGL